MDMTQQLHELCELHITYAGVLNKVADGISARGEDGIVIWLNMRKSIAYPTDIVNHFCLSPGRVANVLKTLEQKQLVTRTHSADDHRKVCVQLTEKGKVYAQKCYDDLLDAHRGILEKMGEEESELVLKLVNRILKAVGKEYIDVQK